ncbi:hypothetical protein ACQW02_26015 [Humitalea sp. 24SJ18S-53]|uniref:hypothetical protein n=1 Tax=Humitalea sp. 24SJ18S-53 TaxID=3422307 RepID=UPI003D67B5C4
MKALMGIRTPDASRPVTTAQPQRTPPSALGDGTAIATQGAAPCTQQDVALVVAVVW